MSEEIKEVELIDEEVKPEDIEETSADALEEVPVETEEAKEVSEEETVG